MDSSGHEIGLVVEDLDPKRTALVVGPFLGLMSAPVVFQVMQTIDQDHTIKSDLIASLVTTVLSIIFMVLINAYLKYNCHLAKRDQQLKAYQQRSFIQKLLTIFSSNETSSAQSATGSHNDSSFSFLYSDRSFADDHDQSKRKIDPKYFKPKFIINELMTFWGTTCTVITWGSFYVIGGTIVATERIAQKIKAKRTNSRDNSFGTSSGGAGSRGTGQSESSFMNMSFRSNSDDDHVTSEGPSRRRAFRRFSSWTKRSYTTIKRKFSRVVTTSVPQFSSLTSSLNTSNISS